MPSRSELANAIRALSMDAVQKANSGHPGMPMGMADIAEVLWNDFLIHNPSNPKWPNRDRFILSNGHGSLLQYTLLHLSGYDVSIDDIKNFRQLHSKTPGHPEVDCAPGVETTTGPLGQGLANAVGMALAERTLAAQFNRPDFSIVDHYTYVFAGDGCLMEGISHEACSLAGTQGLGKLIVFYDDNGISIDGKVEGWFTDDTPKRFEAYHWHVVPDVDGHDPQAIKEAIIKARKVTDKPSIICCKTTIAFGAPNLGGSHKSHGAPLGEDEVASARKHLNWTHQPFAIPSDIYGAWDKTEKGVAHEADWQDLFKDYEKQYSEQAKEFNRRVTGQLPENWPQKANGHIQATLKNAESIATRKASLACLNAYAPDLPELVGGSADLTGSNLTLWENSTAISKNTPDGNYLYYGVREFAMTAIMNGLALHGGFIPYGGTFLVFCDYARNAVRLAALMQQQVILVYSHDSIGLGEDGPTHQPIEHINMLRMTPNMSIWRPCDTVETAVAWQQALLHNTGPTSLLLSRQTLPHMVNNNDQLDLIARGGYIIREADNQDAIDAILIATGSEVTLAIQAAEQLSNEGKSIRVVSMPSTDAFAKQEDSYQEQVLPSEIKNRIAIEAGSTSFWYKYVGLDGKVIGIDRFGESAPGPEVYQAVGLTVENILTTTKELLS